MSDNPTRNFKDFIGWAFVGVCGIVLALLAMIYTSLHAEVVTLDGTTRSHAERIRGTEDRIEGVREASQRIEQQLRDIDKKIDDLRRGK